METVRVDLPDGGWLEICRKPSLALLKKLEERKLGRERTSEMIDTIDTIAVMATAWSYDEPMTPEAVEERIDTDGLTAINSAFKELQSPNGSEPSSAGGEAKATAGAHHRSSGRQGR